MRIRVRRDGDLPSLGRLLTAVHATDRYPVNLPEDAVAFLKVPDALGAWVAVDGGAVVGHVLLRPRTSAPVMALAQRATGYPPERLVVVGRLLVAPGTRRRGIGRALPERAAERALALGRWPVLDVVRDQRAGIALYERAGWQRAGEVTVTFGGERTFEELVFLGPPPDRRQRSGAR